MCLIMISGCSGNRNPDAAAFKADYESLNGLVNDNGKAYRNITVDADNPFRYLSLDEINEKIENGETLIVYFGANWCPWCRSVLPYAIKEARKNKISEIFYVDVRVDNKPENEIRDVYAVDEEGKIYLSHEGTAAYHRFLELAEDVLVPYSRSDVESLDGTEFEGAKRVGAPNYVLFRNGKAVKMVTGYGDLLSDPYAEIDEKTGEAIFTIMDSFFSELK